jgi:DNA-binding XRE family transcriptional regulator
MIANERQYRITQAAVREFEQALAGLEAAETQRPPEVRRLLRDAMVRQLEELREQVTAYEALRGGQVQVLELESLEALPEALIRARIAASLTQKELAARLGLKEQQIQRYEATRYAGVSLERIQAVADALGARIQERVTLPSAHSSTSLGHS